MNDWLKTPTWPEHHIWLVTSNLIELWHKTHPGRSHHVCLEQTKDKATTYRQLRTEATWHTCYHMLRLSNHLPDNRISGFWYRSPWCLHAATFTYLPGFSYTNNCCCCYKQHTNYWPSSASCCLLSSSTQLSCITADQLQQQHNLMTGGPTPASHPATWSQEWDI